jgi:hypothetical protein
MQLEENFLRRVSSLVRDSDLDFWREGRFLVRTDNQLVTYKDGIHNYYFCVTLFLLVWGHSLVFWLCVRFSWYEICIPGMTRVSKSWRAWNTPELTLVTPIAVVGGRKTSLVLKGRNLTIPGTQWVFPDVKLVSDLPILLWMFATHHELYLCRIHCTSTGKYISKEVLCSAYPGTIYDDSGLETFDLPGEPNLILGRCFIEVCVTLISLQLL